MDIEIRNPRFTTFGTIVCDILLDGEWVSFHAMPDDPDQHGRDIFEACKGSAEPHAGGEA